MQQIYQEAGYEETNAATEPEDELYDFRTGFFRSHFQNSRNTKAGVIFTPAFNIFQYCRVQRCGGIIFTP
jgi:hypothetical protein